MNKAEEINADQQAFWNGRGGDIWVARQTHTDITLAPMTEALLAFAQPRPGERVLDIGCGCGATTLDFARAVGTDGQITALDISQSMLREGERRAAASGLGNIKWAKADAAVAAHEEYDLLTSAFGLMFFGNPVAAFAHMRKSASPNARMAFVCWRGLVDNPWMEVPMDAVRPHLPPRPTAHPGAPGMFAFADPEYIASVITKAGWPEPHVTKLDVQLDIAAASGLDAAVEQTTHVGAVNSWLRGQPDEITKAATASIRKALAPYVTDQSVRLPAGMWLVSSQLENLI